MSLSTLSRNQANHFANVLRKISAQELTQAISAADANKLRDEVLRTGFSGKYSTFYSPFDWVNEQADVIIVGITPGNRQALEALQTFRKMILAGSSVDDAAEAAKQSASFKGGMRTLGARLMDHFQLNKLFGLQSTIELFTTSHIRTHYTSVLKYPTLKNFKNYSGHARILTEPFLRNQIFASLPAELNQLPNAWIVPFGSTALSVLQEIVSAGQLDASRILGGILHPGGQQWNRYKVQLGLVGKGQVSQVNGGEKVLQASMALHSRVEKMLAIHHT